MNRRFQMVGSDQVEPLDRTLVESLGIVTERVDAAAERIRDLREKAPSFMETLFEMQCEEDSAETSPVVRSPEDQKKSQLAARKRRKLESCLSELSDMVTQIRENAKLVSENVENTIEDCKKTSKSVAQFMTKDLGGLPKPAAPSSLGSAATPCRNERMGKENA